MFAIGAHDALAIHLCQLRSLNRSISLTQAKRYLYVLIVFAMKRIGFIVPSESAALLDMGRLLKQARLAASLTQEQVADLAGISRPRYRDIERGAAAARATTLMNITRALGLEMMLIPQAMVPAVKSLLRPHADDDLPAFAPQPEEGDRDPEV